jgi:Holliday junction resolvase YEN1
MGIKGYVAIPAFSRPVLMQLHRIYGEIGPGERIALSKLAIENFEQTGRPLRIAIDVSIWQFQTQAGQGGSNPAIRTFYYRLLRLLSTSVQPLFVFDGPHKPPFKRNKRTGQHGAMVPNLLTKQLLKLFGFPFYMAPGEAEAECALLQREGIVDAVLSEDVDTLMFGCGRTLRNWSSEGARGNKSPTHVSVYDAKATKEGKAGLDREGMVLIALMSGGDYITEGIPGCGIKVACEAARAGFGKALCQLSRADTTGLESWRKGLAHEIQTNESKYFRVKHKNLKIPDDFPNREVLGYYTHPVVSSASKVQKLKDDMVWNGEVDVQGLRLFVAEAFDWTHKTGARKFIRGLAPAILVHKLHSRGERRDSGYDDIILTAMNEMELVRAICGKRTHFSTDGLPELRVIYHPAEIVGIDLDAEEDDSGDFGRDGLAPVNDDDQIEVYVSDDATSRSRSTSPIKRAVSLYDPTQPDKAWIPEAIAKVGIPLKVEDYEESLRDPRKFIKAKFAAKKAATNGGMPKGALDRFVKVSKPGPESGKENEDVGPSKPPAKAQRSSQSALPPVYLAPSLQRLTSSQSASTSASSRTTRATRLSAQSSTDILPSNSTNTKTTKSRKALAQKPAPNTNPWTLARKSSSPQSKPGPHKTLSQQPKSSSPAQFKHATYYIDSSPPAAPISSAPSRLRSPTPSRKHQYSPTPPSDHEIEPESEPELPPTVRLTRGSHTSTKELCTPTKNCKDADGPSPRKKVSPGSSERKGSGKQRGKTVRLSPEPVARKLDFACLEMERARSSSPALPSISDLIPARGEQSEVISLDSSPPVQQIRIEESRKLGDMASPPKPKPKGKKYIMIRESMDCRFWTEVDEAEIKEGSRAWRHSQVEVLDLSGDP